MSMQNFKLSMERCDSQLSSMKRTGMSLVDIPCLRKTSVNVPFSFFRQTKDSPLCGYCFIQAQCFCGWFYSSTGLPKAASFWFTNCIAVPCLYSFVPLPVPSLFSPVVEFRTTFFILSRLQFHQGTPLDDLTILFGHQASYASTVTLFRPSTVVPNSTSLLILPLPGR